MTAEEDLSGVVLHDSPADLPGVDMGVTGPDLCGVEALEMDAVEGRGVAAPDNCATPSDVAGDGEGTTGNFTDDPTEVTSSPAEDDPREEAPSANCFIDILISILKSSISS